MKTRYGDRVVPWKALLLAAALAVGAGCKMIPFIGGGYDLVIGAPGSLPSELQSLYVIVARREYVDAALQTSATYGKLLDEEALRNYTSFVQFQPSEGTWKPVFEGKQSEFVEYEVEEERILVGIDADLVEKTMAEFAVVVLGFFGNDGFEQVTVPHMSLAADADQVVDIGPGSLSLRDR